MLGTVSLKWCSLIIIFKLVIQNSSLDTVKLLSGPWFNIKMSSYQYRKSHCGDKMILRPSYLHNGISYNGKMPSLYWIRALVNQELTRPRVICIGSWVNSTEPQQWEVNIGSGNGMVPDITWTNVDPNLCCHIASLGHNDLNSKFFCQWKSSKELGDHLDYRQVYNIRRTLVGN